MTSGTLLPETLLQQLDEHTRAAQTEIDRIPTQIADLTGRLQSAQQLLTWLEVTH